MKLSTSIFVNSALLLVFLSVCSEQTESLSKVPETQEEIKKLDESSRQERAKAEKLRAQAAQAEDANEKNRLESEAQRAEDKANYDTLTAEAGDRKINWQELEKNPSATQEEKTEAEQSYKDALEMQIQVKEQLLEMGFRAAGEAPKTSEFVYRDKLEEKLKTAGTPLAKRVLIKAEVNNIYKNYPDYNAQQGILDTLKEVIEKDPDLSILKDTLRKIDYRLLQIGSESNYVSAQPLAGDALDQKYGFNKLIPLDRYSVLNDILDNFNDRYKTDEEKIKALVDAQTVINHYVIDGKQLLTQKVVSLLEEYDTNTLKSELNSASNEDKLRIVTELDAKAQAQPNYQSQLAILKNIDSVSGTFQSIAPEFKTLFDSISKRYQEIQTFLAKPPEKPVNPTALESKLELWTKIPSDQIKAIGQEIIDATQKQPIDEARINELSDIMKKNQLDQAYPDVAKQLDALKPSLFTKGFNAVKNFVGAVAKPVIDLAGKALEGAANLAAEAVPTVATMVDTGVREGAKIFANSAFDIGLKLEDLGKQMQESPDQIESVLYTMDKIQNGWVTKTYLKGLAFYLSPALGKERVQKLTDLAVNGFVKGKSALEMVQQYKGDIQEFGKKIVEYGKVFQSASEALANVFEIKEVKQAMEAKKAIDNATNIINENRGNLVPSKSVVQRFTDTISTFIKGVKTKLTDVFSAPRRTELKTAKTYYETTRKQYVAALGLEENATKEAITTALQQKSNDPHVVKAAKAFNEALNNLGQIYDRVNKEMIGAFGNLEFLVTAWDSVQLPKDPRQLTTQAQDLVSMVNMINDYRNQKIGYLIAAQTGVQELKTGIGGMVVDPEFQDGFNAYIDKVTAAISGEMVNTLDSHQQEMKYVNDFIDAQKKNIDTWLQSYTDQIETGQARDQAVSGGAQTPQKSGTKGRGNVISELGNI